VAALPMGDAVNGPAADDAPEPGFVLGAGSLVYVLLAAAAMAWLWWRQRLDVLPARAIGEHGPWLSSAVGLGTGIAVAGVFGFTSRRTSRGREYDAVIGRTFARTGDIAAALFVLTGAVAEELFFRLAVQDALGLAGSVAIATAVNSCVGGWRWLPLAAVHALALGSIVHFGFGLLGSTTANAVSNYLNLRRIQCS